MWMVLEHCVCSMLCEHVAWKRLFGFTRPPQGVYFFFLLAATFNVLMNAYLYMADDVWIISLFHTGNHNHSELYGKVQEIPQTEKTPFYPRSPYGACPAPPPPPPCFAAAHWLQTVQSALITHTHSLYLSPPPFQMLVFPSCFLTHFSSATCT